MLIKEYDNREEMYAFHIPKNKIGCEIGVCRGMNATQLFQRTKPIKLYLVDVFPETDQEKKGAYRLYDCTNKFEQVKELFKQEELEGTVLIKRMGSLHFFHLINDHYLDWVYIDGGHYYHQVKKELEMSLLKVKPGGLILGHDFSAGPWKCGVIRAVIEFCQEGKLQMEAISTEQNPTFCCKVL
jgi:hypothetical protein